MTGHRQPVREAAEAVSRAEAGRADALTRLQAGRTPATRATYLAAGRAVNEAKRRHKDADDAAAAGDRAALVADGGRPSRPPSRAGSPPRRSGP